MTLETESSDVILFVKLRNEQDNIVLLFEDSDLPTAVAMRSAPATLEDGTIGERYSCPRCGYQSESMRAQEDIGSIRYCPECAKRGDGDVKRLSYASLRKASHPLSQQSFENDIAIFGMKGSGKSFAAKGIVERLLADGKKVVVLDPMSHWWGLKGSQDGSKLGFPVTVLGGDHQDFPLVDSDPAGIARCICRSNGSFVLDVASCRPGDERLDFTTELLEEMFIRNTDPLWLVIEEADVFAPQNTSSRSEARIRGMIDTIVRRGRDRGFRLITITQRPAFIYKGVSSQASTVIAMKLTSPQDREAIRQWLGGAAITETAKEALRQLQFMETGSGMVYSSFASEAAMKVKFPVIRTWDNSSTPDTTGERNARRGSHLRLSPPPKGVATIFETYLIKTGLKKPALGQDTSQASIKASDPVAPAPVLDQSDARGTGQIGVGIPSDKLPADYHNDPAYLQGFQDGYQKAISVVMSDLKRHLAQLTGGGLDQPQTKPSALTSSPSKTGAGRTRNSRVSLTDAQVMTLIDVSASKGSFTDRRQTCLKLAEFGLVEPTNPEKRGSPFRITARGRNYLAKRIAPPAQRKSRTKR
ncbi:DUF87 domain-containing protein [Sinirhodobacter populi]|uniref:DUF87 domain-containing protein n=1 Tax=Paenirhodobacter populi TaxID=2306993 RepID=A0A443KCF3_9RHOB|nr:DUF87 domain-containing protein [Sinirhodobacter populi]RWR30481.1 DUF87 domain-containing protein [Sinirhodobacter populi]